MGCVTSPMMNLGHNQHELLRMWCVPCDCAADVVYQLIFIAGTSRECAVMVRLQLSPVSMRRLGGASRDATRPGGCPVIVRGVQFVPREYLLTTWEALAFMVSPRLYVAVPQLHSFVDTE